MNSTFWYNDCSLLTGSQAYVLTCSLSESLGIIVQVTLLPPKRHYLHRYQQSLEIGK